MAIWTDVWRDKRGQTVSIRQLRPDMVVIPAFPWSVLSLDGRAYEALTGLTIVVAIDAEREHRVDPAYVFHKVDVVVTEMDVILLGSDGRLCLKHFETARNGVCFRSTAVAHLTADGDSSL